MTPVGAPAGGAQLAQWICATIRESTEAVDHQCAEMERQASKDALASALDEASHLRDQADAMQTAAWISGGISVASGAVMGAIAMQGAGPNGQQLQSDSSQTRQFEAARQLGATAQPVSQLGEASGMRSAAASREDRALGDAAQRESQQWMEQRQQAKRTQDNAMTDLKDITRLAHEAMIASIGRRG